jgi:trimethylamine-N-oxide reductase (cytochrome c)
MDLDSTDGRPGKLRPGAVNSRRSPDDNLAYTAGFKSMIYSDKRCLYPMKRVDFDPNGDRKIQTGGISGYERISWEEAVDIVTNEVTGSNAHTALPRF